MVNLTEHEKDKFVEFEDRGGEDMLTPDERVLEEKLKNLIVNGVPLDKNHEGIQNLSPNQEEQFRKIEAKKEQGYDLKPEEKNQLNGLQELLRDGDPIDERHAGTANLTPLQQDRFKDLLKKAAKNQPSGADSSSRSNNKKGVGMHPSDIEELNALKN